MSPWVSTGAGYVDFAWDAGEGWEWSCISVETEVGEGIEGFGVYSLN